MQYEEKDFRLAEEFCGIVLGTDEFYRKRQMEASDETSFTSEGLVPVNFSGVSPVLISSWQEAIDKLTDIYHRW